jgi:hypothetical protein
MRDHIVIHLTTRRNPHRFGTDNRRRWSLIREGMTVGEFVSAHGVAEDTRAASDARKYLAYMVQRGLIELPGYVPAPRRVRRQELAATSALSTELDGFTFGVEFEVWLPRGTSHSAAAAKLTEAGVTCRSELYGHSTPTNWKVITDGSLGNYRRGAEFVSPILQGAVGLAEVEKVARALHAMGATVNKRCGFHVHVGAANEQANFFRSALRLYSRNEWLIDAVMPLSRRGNNNEYCQPIRLRDITDDSTRSEILRTVNVRHAKLSVASYSRHGTIEFRQHAGTVEADKASFWIKFCLRLCNAAQAGRQEAAESLAGLLDSIGAAEDEKIFFSNREARLATLQQVAA